MDIVAISKEIIEKKTAGLIGSLIGILGKEIQQFVGNRILEYQVEEYNRNYYTKTLLHRVQPKALAEIYQPLYIKPYTNYSSRKGSGNGAERIATSSVSELFALNQFITIIGSAGSGKSTMIKHLFINSIDTNYKIPIKVELRYLNDYNDSLIQYVKDRVFKLNKLAKEDRIIERLMGAGKFIVFLDGYDELNSTRKEAVTKEIDDLVKRYNKNSFLLSTRPYTDVDLLPLFCNYKVCDLSKQEIKEFIHKQIPTDEKELDEKIVAAIESPENEAYRSFLSNPLLLSMFILTFQSYSSIPQKRSEFYRQVFDTLYSTHDSMSKLAYVREKQSGLNKDQFIQILKLFSFISYFEEQFIFNSAYLSDKLNVIKEKKRFSFENEKLINDLQVAINILNKEGLDYSFPHRSLQEYFAAIYIKSINEEHKKTVYDKINERFRMNKRLFLSYDNFYLLLSELDEKNVIKYIVIDTLEESIHKIQNVNEVDYMTIISWFSLLKSLCSSFYQFIPIKEIPQAEIRFNKVFNEYMITEDKRLNSETETEPKSKLIRKKRDKYGEQVWEFARQKLAMNDIAPFLRQIQPVLINHKNNLTSYLNSESQIESDIISLIN